MTTIRRLLAMALAIATAIVVIPAGPANAAGQPMQICFPVGEYDGHTIFDCYWIVLPESTPNPPGPIECLSCPAAIDFLDDQLDPKIRLAYLDLLGQGLGPLSQAAVSEDPDMVKKLRAQATEAFLASAKTLGKTELGLYRVGYADLQNNKFFEDSTSDPMLEAAGQHLVAGLTLMQEALGDPSPQPNIEEAMATFDLAYTSLVKR